jgi:hypothetical protein
MTAENFDRILRGLTDRTPFQVFTVELHGGHRFEVDQPRAMVVRDGVAVFIAPGGVPIWFDHHSVSSGLELVSLAEKRAVMDAIIRRIPKAIGNPVSFKYPGKELEKERRPQRQGRCAVESREQRGAVLGCR